MISTIHSYLFFPFYQTHWPLIFRKMLTILLYPHPIIQCVGKTVVGEMGLYAAFSMYQKHAIYTTPLKALSNQKYGDLCPMFGKANVGLSTGDVSVNKGAPVTVMTTEVYRNIAWRASSGRDQGGVVRRRSDENELTQNAVVVLDELHYLGHPGRGGVWEESIITSPKHTQIVGLSATLPNAPQLASWMQDVTGRRTVLVNMSGTKARPVPLRYLFATKEGLFPLFRDPEAGPGARRGLLGLRGDGFDPKDTKLSKREKKKGFGAKKGSKEEESSENADSGKLPRGLHVNPALKAAADKRIQKVNRAIERKKVQSMRQQFREDDDYPEDEWGLRRGRRGPMPQRRMSARDERREREFLLKKEMRRAVPSLSVLLKRLDQKDLLPAIFFIFSRAGCDEAARNVCNFMRGPTRDSSVISPEDPFGNDQPWKKRKTRQRGRRWRDDEDDDEEENDENDTRSTGSRNNDFIRDKKGRMFRSNSNYISDDVLEASINEIFQDGDGLDEDDPLNKNNFKIYAEAGLLNYQQVETVASKIKTFNEENEEIAFPNGIMMQYLFGVGSHHAGMLPAHKSFVEILYRNQLMKAVFATETLAAGINMPARTTVICALAKRGDGNSMNLLETSNLLQMAGRAGRRGFDVEGHCVIVATPFEDHDDAAKILTDPVAPISSQFSPSYSLAINLVARGQGKLDVAKQLVGSSFAMWEKRQMENDLMAAVEKHGEGVNEMIETSAHERFMNSLVDVLQLQLDKRNARFDANYVEHLVSVLQDRELLKKASKSYLGAIKMLELESNTLGYLEAEHAATQLSVEDKEDELIGELFQEDESNILDQIKFQRSRITKIERDINKHPFTAVANIANDLMCEMNLPEGKALLGELQAIREYDDNSEDEDSDESIIMRSNHLTPEDLCTFAKSTIVIRRKTKKFAKANSDLDPIAILEQAEMIEETGYNSWDDMMAIIKVLVAHGCLSMSSSLSDHDSISLERESFDITPAGNNLGQLGFDNSLWCLVAMGGAWDVIGASSRLDRFRSAMKAADYDSDVDWYDNEDVAEEAVSEKDLPRPQQEAEDLVSLLRQMTASELAGYVSCLISEGSRGGMSVVDIFQRMSPIQQRVIQSSLQVMERFMEVQKDFDVDENTRACAFDVANCKVVTAWAAGCTWSEALEISGSPPGDLARNLSRVLDAVRQLGNLPFRALRKGDFNKSNGDVVIEAVSRGLHPEIRNLCREAARAINRYPVKDPLQFAEIEDAEIEEEDIFDVTDEENLDEDENKDLE